MNPAVEVYLLVTRELRRNLRSAKGLVLLLICLIAAAGAALVMTRASNVSREQGVDTEQAAGLSLQFLQLMYDQAVASRLLSAPLVPIAMFVGMIFLLPAFIALVSFDSVSSELQFKSVRYWTVRVRRSSFFVGKVLGVFTLVAATTLLMNALTWGIAIAREAPFGSTVAWGLTLWASAVPQMFAWCSMAVFVSSLVKTPVLALMGNFAANFVLWLVYVIGQAKLEALTYVYPNRYDVFLLSPDSTRVLLGLVGCFGFAAVFLVAGAVIFQRRDL